MNKILMAGITGLATIGTMGIYQEVNACGVGCEEFEVTASELNVRSGPGTGYSRIGSVKKGQKFVPFEAEHNGTWAKIKLPNGKKGWVSMTYMKSTGNCTEESNSSDSQIKDENWEGVTTANLNIRYGAGTNYSIKTTLPKGTVVTVKHQVNGWYRVEYKHNGRFEFGYASKQYVSAYSGSVNNATSNTLKLNEYRISSNSVRLRQSHFMERSFGLLEKGDIVEVLDDRPVKHEGNIYYKVKVIKSKNTKLVNQSEGRVAIQFLVK